MYDVSIHHLYPDLIKLAMLSNSLIYFCVQNNGLIRIRIRICVISRVSKAGAARSRGIWLEPEPSLWPGSGSTLNICLIIHANYIELDLI